MEESGWDVVAESTNTEDNDLYMEDVQDEDELGLDADEEEVVEQGKEKDKEVAIRTVDGGEKEEGEDNNQLELLARDKNINVGELSPRQKADLNVLRRYSTHKKVEDTTPKRTEGRVWKAKIYKNGFVNAKNKRDFKNGKLKPKRPTPVIYEKEFFNRLVFDQKEKKYFLKGELNGWPALKDLELLSLEFWYSRKDRFKTVTLSRKIWTPKSSYPPSYPDAGSRSFLKKPSCIRAILKAPKYTEIGYSLQNPGFLFWFRPYRENGPRMGHGEKIIKALENDAQTTKVQLEKAKRVSFFSHRYAKKTETPKDKITYHTGLLIEWNHQKYTTLVELAYLYGIGGFGGKSNWLTDRDSGNPLLWQCMADDLKAPWKNNRAEIRLIDMKVKDASELLNFMKSHEGRFLKPSIKGSDDVRISLNRSTDLVKYLANYICRDRTYSEEFRNCQTFAADFYNLLTGGHIEPLYPVKLFYKNKARLFLYDHNQFLETNKKKEKKNKMINPSKSKHNHAKAATNKIYNKLFG